eukprot:SAG11_NODE_31142_length_294_cov_1.035897_1_plen_24_part_10
MTLEVGEVHARRVRIVANGDELKL